MKVAEHVHGFPSIARFSDQFHVGLIGQNGSDAFPDQRMVVHAQHTDRSFGTHFTTSRTAGRPIGATTDTVVPRPGVLSNSNSAPICAARSFPFQSARNGRAEDVPFQTAQIPRHRPTP